MGLQLSELITRVRDVTGRSNATQTTDAQITRLLNDAQRASARRHNWRDLYIEKETTLTADTYRYSLPSDMKVCMGMRIIDGSSSRTLHEKTKTWLNWREPYPATRSSGKPTYYCIDGNYFELYPPPDSAYTLYINYVYWPVEMSEDSDTPSVDDLDDALIAYAASDLYAMIEMNEQSDWWRERYDKMLKEAKAVDMSRPAWLPKRSERGRGLPADYWKNPFIGL